jgi:hypothetical protein
MSAQCPTLVSSPVSATPLVVRKKSIPASQNQQSFETLRISPAILKQVIGKMGNLN